MAIPISNVNSVSDTFLDWLSKTNSILDNLSTKVVTTEANTTGGVTVGNAFIEGVLSANTITVIDGLRGGTVDTAAVLDIVSNVAIVNASSNNIFTITSNSTVSALTSNIAIVTFNITNTDFVGGVVTLTSNVSATGNSFLINVNNANVSGNNLSITTGNVTVNSTLVTIIGGSASTIEVGNTTTNTIITYNSIKSGSTLEVPGVATLSGNVYAGANAIVVDAGSGRVAINSNNTSNTTNRLFIDGNTYVSANLYVLDRIETNVVSCDTFSVTGNIAFSGTSDGDFRPTSNSFSLGNTSNRWILFASSGNFANDVAISGNVSISGVVTGNVDFDSNTLFVDADNNRIQVSSANVVGVLNARANVVANGQLIVSNTADLGNTTVTGFANITSTLSSGNTTVTGFVNVSSTANIGGVLSARANVVANGQLIVSNTASLGNTTITGFANISLTANIGGVLSARANVVANGQLIVSNTASIGNTTITGFANVSNFVQVGSDVVVNTSSLQVGNSTSNSIIVHNQVKVSNSTNETTINPSVINVGANASINVSSFKIGNTTANAVLNVEKLTIQSNSITNSTITSTTITIANVVATNLSGNGVNITTINASSLGSGTVPTARLGSGANSTNFLGGDQTYKMVPTILGTTATTTTRTVTVETGTNVTLPGASSTEAGVMTAADKSKLDGIASGAQVNVDTNLSTTANTTTRTIASSTGTDVILPGASSTEAGVMTSTDKGKLDGIASGAQTGTVTSIATQNGITGGTITTSGTLGLTGIANSIHHLSSTGFIIRNGTDTAVIRSLGAGTGVSITNSDGVSGNPSIAIGQAVATGSSVQFGSLGVGTPASGTTGEIRATWDITAHYSDERLKDIIGAIPNALDKVSTLTGFYFKENETAKSLGYNYDKRQVGVSAQKVQEVLPEVVKPAPINDKYLTVQYEKLVPLLIEAIKELNTKVINLEKQLIQKNGTES